MKIIEEKLANGDVKVSIEFVAASKATAKLSSTGKMKAGLATGFTSTPEGNALNIYYGYRV